MNAITSIGQASGGEDMLTDFLKRIRRATGRFFEWYTGRMRVFDIGVPEDYAVGIDHRWREAHGFWVVRNHRGIFVVMAGAPEPWAWPLVRVRVWCDATGRLLVDPGRKFQYERGEWDDPASFVRLDENGRIQSALPMRSVGGK